MVSAAQIGLTPVRERRWSWGKKDVGEIKFYLPKNGALTVVKDGKRGEAFVKRVAALACSSCMRSDVALDIGANEGFYAMLAAAHGCGVFAFDLQQGCVQPFEAARSFNARVLNSSTFDRQRVRFITRPLSEDTSGIMLPSAPGMCGHMARLPRQRTRTIMPLGGAALRTLLECSLYRSIVLAKVDVEGAELKVLDALAPVIPNVQHLVVEVTPGLWPSHGHYSRGAGFAQIANLLSGRARFGAARTSTGCTFERDYELQRHLRARHWSRWGVVYREGQIDIWFARDAMLLQRANARITGFLGRGDIRSDARYPDDPKNTTCPEPGAQYLRPRKYRSAAEAEEARVALCRFICGAHPRAFR